MKRIAYGELGLKPDEFYSLLYIEFIEMVDAFVIAEQRRQLLEDKRAAFIVAEITNVWRKRKVKPEDYTKEGERRYLQKIKPNRKHTNEERKQILKSLEERLGG
ncbi:hypothetical protein NYE37_03915 [Thermoactinomyces sp. FSL K6-2592]|jgi:hypothetical protein|uniref:hypothetical protein n=1 Tax=Thermoactinomyces sp. FSL K6-2592 TaxID=2975347 RepID=UPI0030F5C07F